MFYYNWQIRDEWFEWCKQISYDELIVERTGGLGSIIHTLFHIIYAEQLWICGIKGVPPIQKTIDSISNLEDLKEYSRLTRPFVKSFIEHYTPDNKYYFCGKRADGSDFSYPWNKVLQHLIVHEVHHIGQLSIWARELGYAPVKSDIISRRLN